ncbi:hypothetical protein ILYODFUR_011245 [Ilyodon furcidens]|uniref:Uncharacterized protein n=1 Tax=Ilyodon furcidens TaxID=33524 RepID=A0ABV0U6A9_9TELE
MRSLNGKRQERSGVDTSMWDSRLDVFGKYKVLVSSVIISFAVFAAILTLCGCCYIPCLHSLLNRLITTAISPMEDRVTQLYLVLKHQDDGDDDDPTDHFSDLYPDPSLYNSVV